MEAVQKENWYFVALLISLSFLKVSEQLKSPSSTVTLQNGMLLNCTCPWTGKLVMVTWTKGVNSSPLAVYHPDYGVNFNSAYDGRVEFINTSAMDGSIRVTNVTEEDEGVYQCSMQTFPQGSWSKETLVKKQVTPTFSQNPNTTLNVSENEGVTISCSHNDLVDEVSLERIEGADGTGRLLAVCRKNADDVQQFVPGVKVNCTDEMVMEVRFNSVTRDDAGIYRCNFSMDAEVSTSLILLRMFSSPEGLQLHSTMT